MPTQTVEERERELREAIEHGQKVISGEIPPDIYEDLSEHQRYLESLKDIQAKYDILQQAKAAERSYQEAGEPIGEEAQRQIEQAKAIAISPAAPFVEISPEGDILVKDVLAAEKAGVPLSEFERMGFRREDIQQYHQELSHLKETTPQLYRILASEGIEAFNRAVTTQQFVEQKEEREFKQRNTQLPDGQWIDKTELANIQKDFPDVHTLLTTKGFDAANAYIDKYSAEIKTAQEKEQSLRRELAPYTIRKMVDDKVQDVVNVVAYLKDNPTRQQTLIDAGIDKTAVIEATRYIKQPWVRETAQEKVLKTFIKAGGSFSKDVDIDKLIANNPELLFLPSRDEPLASKLKPTMTDSEWVANFVAVRINDPVWAKERNKEAILKDMAIREYQRLYGKGKLAASQTIEFLEGFVPSSTAKAIASKQWATMSTPDKIALISGDVALTILYSIGLYQLGKALAIRPPKVILPKGSGGLPAEAVNPKTTLSWYKKEAKLWELNMSHSEFQRFLDLKRKHRALTVDAFKLSEDLGIPPKEAVRIIKTGLIPEREGKLWQPQKLGVKEPQIQKLRKVAVEEVTGLTEKEKEEFFIARTLDSKLTPAEFKMAKIIWSEMPAKEAAAVERKYIADVLQSLTKKQQAEFREAIQRLAAQESLAGLSPEFLEYLTAKEKELGISFREALKEHLKAKAEKERALQIKPVGIEGLTDTELYEQITSQIRQSNLGARQKATYEARLVEIREAKQLREQEAQKATTKEKAEAIMEEAALQQREDLEVLSQALTEIKALPSPLAKPKTAVKTRVLAIPKTAVQTKLETQLQVLPKTQLQTQTELQTKLQALQKTAVKTAVLPQTITQISTLTPTPTPIPTPMPGPALTPTPTSISIKPTKPSPRPKPLKPIKPKKITEEKEEELEKEPVRIRAGKQSWRQGKVTIVITHPEERVKYTASPKDSRGTPKQTLRAIGKVPSLVELPMGIVRVKLRNGKTIQHIKLR